MSETDKKTDDLINNLCGNLEPVKACCPYRQILIWAILSFAYLWFAIQYIGVRHDFSERIGDPIYIFEIGLAVFMLVTAALSSSWLSFPDGYQKNAFKAVPITIGAIFLFWIVVHSYGEGMSPFQTMHLGHCAREGLYFELLPFAALIYLTLRGKTTQPYWSITMNILAVCAIGWLGLRFTCVVEDMGHSFFNHFLPFAIVGAGVALFAKRLFKW